MGMLAKLHLGIGLSVSVISSFFICLLSRIIFGHKIAKIMHERILGRGLFYWMAAFSYWSLSLSPFPPLPPKEAFVIVCNHASFCDHAILSFLPIHKKYLTKKKYFVLPFFGWTQWLVKDIGVDVKSKESREKCIQDCVDMIKSGNSIVIYPEGTRSKNPPELGEFHQGAFMIAQRCNARILPVCILHTHEALGPGFNAGKGEMKMVVGHPFFVQQPQDIPSSILKVKGWMQQVILKDQSSSSSSSSSPSPSSPSSSSSLDQKNEKKVQ